MSNNYYSLIVLQQSVIIIRQTAGIVKSQFEMISIIKKSLSQIYLLRMIRPNLITQFYMSQKKKICKIMTLNQIWESYQIPDSENFIQQLKKQQQPSQIYLGIIRAIKLGLFFDNDKKQIILSKILVNIENMDYLKHMIYILLPINYQFEELNKLYVKIGINFLNNVSTPTASDLLYILYNLERTVFDGFVQWADEYWLVRDYSQEQRLGTIILEHILKQQQEIQMHFLLKLTRIYSILNIYHPQFSEMLIKFLYSPNNRPKLKQILEILSYLSSARCFPNQYFYPRKKLWIDIIEVYPQYSTKKSLQTLKFLGIVIRQNPPQSERIIQKIIKIMNENTLSLDNEELARQWYLMCKAKFLFPPQMIEKTLFKIQESIKNMQSRQLCIIVRGFSRFRGYDYTFFNYNELLQAIDKRLPQSRLYQKKIIAAILKQKIGNKTQQFEFS